MSDYSKEEKSRLIVEKLNEVFDVRVFEDKNPYRVLVRTILSQRTRDENTDQATNNLFSKYKDIYEVADAPTEDVEELIRCSGFYRVKAGRIKEVSRILIDQYGGEVPDNMKELLELPGVGRKTANCVLVYAFEEPEDIKILLNDLMVQFGQNICKPISPQCEICPLDELCDKNI